MCFTSGSDTARLLTGHRSETYWCDRSDNRTDICYIHGDVHLYPGIAGQKVSVHLFSNDDSTWHGEEQIQPYTRKYDPATMDTVDPVVLKSKYTEFFHPVESVCDIVHSVPLILFSAGGYTGNPYHDFQDVLVPMFITSKPYNGEVVFGITQARDWWLEKFSPLLRQMTKYEIIDMNQNKKVHCFPDATIGLRLHGELKVDPAHMPHNETMKDFQDMVHRAYGDCPSHKHLAEAKASSRCANYSLKGSDCKLKLVILARNQTRMILNQAQVASFAQREGFDVQVLNPWGGTNLRTLYKYVILPLIPEPLRILVTEFLCLPLTSPEICSLVSCRSFVSHHHTSCFHGLFCLHAQGDKRSRCDDGRPWCGFNSYGVHATTVGSHPNRAARYRLALPYILPGAGYQQLASAVLRVSNNS